MEEISRNSTDNATTTNNDSSNRSMLPTLFGLITFYTLTKCLRTFIHQFHCYWNFTTYSRGLRSKPQNLFRIFNPWFIQSHACLLIHLPPYCLSICQLTTPGRRKSASYCLKLVLYVSWSCNFINQQLSITVSDDKRCIVRSRPHDLITNPSEKDIALHSFIVCNNFSSHVQSSLVNTVHWCTTAFHLSSYLSSVIQLSHYKTLAH